MSLGSSTFSLDSEKSDTDLSGTEDTEEVNWVEWFCGQQGKESFVEVDEEYINDDFNLTGLQSLVPQYRRALDLILDIADPEEDESAESEEQQTEIEVAAQVLYGLIHARFILTNRGMQLVQEKYEAAIYGHCPNTYCGGQPVLPVGISDYPSYHKCKVFCHRCNEVYHPEICRLAELDGAYFGTSFAHLFFMRYRDQNNNSQDIQAQPIEYYRPKIYGFKVDKNVKDRLRELHSNLSMFRQWHRPTVLPSGVPTTGAGGIPVILPSASPPSSSVSIPPATGAISSARNSQILNFPPSLGGAAQSAPKSVGDPSLIAQALAYVATAASPRAASMHINSLDSKCAIGDVLQDDWVALVRKQPEFDNDGREVDS